MTRTSCDSSLKTCWFLLVEAKHSLTCANIHSICVCVCECLPACLSYLQVVFIITLCVHFKLCEAKVVSLLQLYFPNLSYSLHLSATLTPLRTFFARAFTAMCNLFNLLSHIIVPEQTLRSNELAFHFAISAFNLLRVELCITIVYRDSIYLSFFYERTFAGRKGYMSVWTPILQ